MVHANNRALTRHKSDEQFSIRKREKERERERVSETQFIENYHRAFFLLLCFVIAFAYNNDEFYPYVHFPHSILFRLRHCIFQYYERLNFFFFRHYTRLM